MIGFQIRNRATGKDDPKYPWLSTSSRPANLKNGELPITYAPGDGSVLNLCEGILKPLVAAEIHGAQFIGAAGGNFASSPEQLRECISALLPLTIALCPDGGALANRQVMHQYSLLAELVTELGYELKVRWWGQVTKASGDVDEITREQFEQSALISWAEFAALAPKAEEKSTTQPHPQVKPAQTKAQWAEQQKVERDRQSYAKIAKLLGIKANVNTDDPDYKNQAREIFYQPLKRLAQV